MSALCTASSELLVLDYSDLYFLSENDDKKPLARDIEIRFIYNAGFIIGPEGISGRLAIPEWELGTTLLCGSCLFCLLIQQGVRRSLDSCPWPWLGLAAIFEDETHIPVTVDVRLNKFAYVKDTSPWAAGQENLKTWNVHSVSLGGIFSLKFGPGLEQVAKLIETELVLPLVELQFEMFADQNNSLAKLLKIHRKSLDSSPLSDTNVSNIRRWMDECDRDHEWCSIHSSIELARSSNFLPTRLLDVGNSETGVQVRLVLTDTFSETERRQKDSSKYMALSYCWGSAEESRRLLKTTHSTIQERLRAIEFNTMPLAVQDAVTVARTLKIQYIWIDSLCIIQDDTEDWQIESSRMGDIFSNAYLTVVAAVGSSCHDSFLYREPNQLSCDVNVQSQVFGIDDGQFSLRSRRRRGTEKMSEIFDSKWISRGWTFQEERLARRVLMFGKNKFFLDCRTIERAEDTEYYTLRPDWVGSVCDIPAEENGAIRASKYSQMRSTGDHWQTLCSHYSYRELTFAADKLPAISGIASKFSEKLGGTYLAGLWKDYLMHDLFWYSAHPTIRPQNYRAPSWSWASVDRKISYPFWRTCGSNECEMYCTILDAQVTIHGLDPFGAVSDGYLRIQGTLLEMEACQRPERKASLPQWSLYFQNLEVAWATPDSAKLDPGEPKIYWALLFAKCRGSKGSRARKSQARGLLLEKCEQERDGLGVFQRVGVFYISQAFSENIGPAVDLWRRSADESTIVII